MKAIIGADIILQDCSEDFAKLIKSRLTFDNPEWVKKAARGYWTGNTPKELVLWQRRGNDLVIPFGMLRWLFSACPKLSYERRISGLRHFEYGATIQLFEYQEKAVEQALYNRQGVIVAPCGSGKTQIGLEIAARLGGRTLWLTHTQELLRQSMDRAKSVYNLPAEAYGTITAGKINAGSVITFATVQTMSKIDLTAWRDYWDVIIVDEAHHAAGTPTKLMMFWRVVSSLAARYKFGLTATPKRTDGLTPCMYALLGEKICEIDKSEVAERTVPVHVWLYQTDYEPDVESILNSDGTLDYVKLITDLSENQARNERIADDALRLTGKRLILAERVGHINLLADAIKRRGGRSMALYGNVKKKEREKILSEFETGSIDILIATYALAKEGLDIPSLSTIIFASPQKNEIMVTQSAGRVERKADGKLDGNIIDYEDKLGILRGWQKKRISIYKKLGFRLH